MNSSPTSDSGPPPLPEGIERTPGTRSRWRWWVHVFILTVFPLLALTSALPGMEFSGPALTRSARGLLIVCAIQLFFFALIFGLAWIFSRASRDALLLRWRGGLWSVPLSALYSVALRLVVGILVVIGYSLILVLRGMTPEAMQKSVMNNRPQVEALVDLAALRNDPAYFWLTLTLVSFVLAGLREELWRAGFLAGLRALWPRWFNSRAGQILGMGIAAVFFGLAHVRMGLLAVFMTAVLGFGLGIIMVLHRSIWPAVMAHGFFNAATFAVLPWLTEKLPELQKSLGH